MKINNFEVITSISEMNIVIKSAMTSANLSASLIQNAGVWAVRQTFSGNITPLRKIITALDKNKLYMKYKNVFVEFAFEFGKVRLGEGAGEIATEVYYDKGSKNEEPSKSRGESWRMWNEGVRPAPTVKPLCISDEVRALLRAIKNKTAYQEKNGGDYVLDVDDAVINALSMVLDASAKAAANHIPPAVLDKSKANMIA